MKIFFLILLVIAAIPIKGQQEKDIVNYLKQIESGESESVLKILPELKSKNSNDPSILFLEAILTEDGNKAVTQFEDIVSRFPKSKYADAALYRASSFYYAMDDQIKAYNYFNKLKAEYPASPYIKLADRNYRIKKEEQKKTVTSKSTEKNYKFTIQAGAFSNKSNAESLKKDLADSGVIAEIKEKNVAGSIFHVVYAGKFVSEDEAKDELEILNRKFNLNGRVTGIINEK